MRQLFISADTAPTFDGSGLLADGSVTIQKKDANGEAVPVVGGDSPATVKEIRFVQGHANGKNYYGPWIKLRSIQVYDGRSSTAQVGKEFRLTISDPTTSAGTQIIKFIRKDVQPQEFYNLSVEQVSGAANTAQATAINAAATAAKNDGSWPAWLSTTVDISSNTVDFHGIVDGGVTNEGDTWEDGAVNFECIVDNSEVTGSSFAVTVQTALTIGNGSGYQMKKFEDSLMGSGFGYYNRIGIKPNAPANSAVVGTAYDMYTIVATKDGSTSPQIKGVDNLIEMYVAVPAGSQASNVTIETDLNGLIASQILGFTPINL